MIEDRMRGNGNGGAVVWVFDERRRVRDEVAGRLLALPFVSRVEAVGDAVSLRTRLDNRLPDVLLVGTQRATDSGLSVATQVLRSHPSVPVLVLGAPDDAETVRAAVALGARGYLRWDASPLELGLGLSRTGMRPELSGRPQLAPAPRAPQHAVALAGGAPSGPSPWGGASPLAAAAPTTVRSTVPETPQVALSMREMQVLTGMSQGKSNAQIGRELYLSEDTIKTHARRLFRKLGAKDRAEAVATGFRRGMMS
ncbi:Response regulator containing a CheY-like receiver domain and an HTH DNA-binding domain [Modestobacter italicus]|uniref:Response regulator containing a CheY-like receiver domain and an HTH DNA-binding domain n=1 Tax=Modestobacter italicus (strain DSM 44449 / CECT 9708 / BC 501) TaxID=2732864 RepID=I4F3M3_MODI5|nr:response regulator transcription factor [Modestobacter marinus]CCH90236.1 Response regulator containing a CheY-like receiver domain and an HTH DNA-binding domain [Modestobacter marinus]